MTAKKTKRVRKPRTVGGSITQGLKEAIAWTKGENGSARVTLVHVPVIAAHPEAVEDVLRKAG